MTVAISLSLCTAGGKADHGKGGGKADDKADDKAASGDKCSGGCSGCSMTAAAVACSKGDTVEARRTQCTTSLDFVHDNAIRSTHRRTTSCASNGRG